VIDQQAHADRVECCFASEREALLRFAVSMVGPDHAQDIVATALTSVLERRSSPPIIDMRSFLFRTVHNAANHHWRTQNRRLRRQREVLWTERYEDHPDCDPTIRRALNAMSLRQRAVIYLAYWEDQTNASIATTLGISLGSVKRHRTRALQRLKEHYT